VKTDPMTCTQVRELAPELAMDVLAGPERGDALAHLDGCASCRAFVAELAETADLLVLAAPEAEPPPGFAERVLAAARPPARRTWRRNVAIVGIAAAVAAIVSIATVRIVQNDDELFRPAAQGSATPPVFRAVAMRGGDGHLAGSVFVSSANPAALNVSVQYAVPDGEYRVELVDSRGKAEKLGRMDITNGWGRWSGHVRAQRLSHARLALVDSTGRRVCEANLDGQTIDDAYGIRGDAGPVASGIGFTGPTG
jgi:hypothetical protein